MEKDTEINKIFREANKYLNESKNDSQTEPFKSMNLALSCFQKLKVKVVDALEKAEDHEKIKYKGMLAAVLQLMGSTSIDVEEYSAAEEYLNEALKFVVDDLDPKFIIASIIARNQLGILLSKKGEYNSSKDILESALDICIKFEQKLEKPKPMKLYEHFGCPDEDPKQGNTGEGVLSEAIAMTKYYLAQVYGKLGDKIKSVRYCYETLVHQLGISEIDPIDWALNAATLSQVFLEQYRYKQARHLLAAASFILDTYENKLKVMQMPQEEIDAKREELNRRKADVARCWTKYGLFLLDESKSQSEVVNEPSDGLSDCWFHSLDLTPFESLITDHLVNSFEEARDLMLATQKWINKAKEYYTLEHHASDHTEIVQDHSTLFRHLLHFEKDKSRVCKMHKKRINLLNDVLIELNPKYYLKYCRELWFELGETYHSLQDLKKRQHGTNLTNNLLAAMKVTHMGVQSVKYFTLFLNSVKGKDGNYPKVIPNELLRGTLVANFYIGLLCYKLPVMNKTLERENIDRSYFAFKFMTDYIEANPTAKDGLELEYTSAQEMTTLLEFRRN